MHQDRDAEPRVLDGPMLRSVYKLGRLARVPIDRSA
jgi:hypothetical protein